MGKSYPVNGSENFGNVIPMLGKHYKRGMLMSNTRTGKHRQILKVSIAMPVLFPTTEPFLISRETSIVWWSWSNINMGSSTFALWEPIKNMIK
jgi:hypothetical protein